MNRRALLAALAVLAVPVTLRAHGGHDHVMGTVTAVSAETLEVEDKAGKRVVVHLTAQTKYLRGKEAAAAADVKEGPRVVVDTRKDGARTVAVEVKLGVAKPASPK
jgi:hypothetical protein